MFPRLRSLPIVLVAAVLIAPAAIAADVPFNGGFETGDYAPDWTVSTNYPGFAPFVFTGTPLPELPELTPYEGTYSFAFYRNDGQWQGATFHPVPGWYECAYARQSYRIAPGPYTFSVAGAGFVHHDRFEDQDEDPWGAGVAVNIYIDDPDRWDPVYSHDWWPSQSGGSVNVDGMWIYGDKLDNYVLPSSGDRSETSYFASEEVEVVVEIIFLSKWDTDLDVGAIDGLVIDGLPAIAVAEPSPVFTGVERLADGKIRFLFEETGDEAASYAIEGSDAPDQPGVWTTETGAVVSPMGGGLFQADVPVSAASRRYYRGVATP